MDFEVRHIDGTTVKLISSEHKCAITSATQTRKLCGNDTVTINLQSATYIDFYVGDKITIFGTTYTLNQLPTVKKESERSYTYTLVFEGLQYTLIDRVFLMPANTQGDNLMFDLAGMLDVLDDNINRGNSGKQYVFELDESLEETEYKNLSLTGKNCLQVLQQLCQEWDTEFVFAEEANRIAIYIGVAGSTFPTTFKYGRGGGVYELNREKGASDICTRLFVYGGTQNLTYYRHNRLCLPSKEKNQSYVEDATAQAVYGIKEQVKNFDDIYPNRIGTITSLSGCDYNEFIDSDMADEEFGFDLNEKWANNADDCEEWLALKGLEDTEANRTIYYNDVAGTATKYLMAGATAKIHFNTGALAGYECDLHSYTHSNQKFVLKPLVDENGYDFPSKTNAAFKLAVGDEYVILDINLPTAYKEEAESKLATEAASYFETVCRPQPKYTLTIEPIALKHIVGPSTADTEIFKVGDLINISDPTGGVESATIRIDQFVRNLLDPFDYKLTLTDEITYSQQVRTLIEVDAIKRVVEESKIYDVNRIRRGWKDAEELYNQMFDTEGHYYSEKIAPLSIDTQMLKVGARSQQLVLQNVLFQPNYNANPANLQISAGSLVHYTIAEPDIKTWTMSALSASNVPSTAQYVYAKCARNGTTGTWLVTDQAIIFDSDPSYYHFLVGSLSSVDSVSNTRNFAATYGFTTINGRNITTGVIKSSDGSSVVIDLDAGIIKGNITFESGTTSYDALQSIIGNNSTVVGAVNTANTANTNASNAVSTANTANDTANRAEGKIDGLEIGGRNYIRISDAWEQGTGDTVVGKTWEQCKISSTQRIRTKTTIAIKKNTKYTISIKSGYKYELDKFSNGLATGYVGWLTDTYTFDSGDNDSVAFLVSFAVNGAITPAEIENVKIKLEQGTVATDWTPAPEDRNYEDVVGSLVATCASAANASEKEIICPELTAKMLTDSKMRMRIKFTNANTQSTFKLVFRNVSGGAAITPIDSGATTSNVRLWYSGASSSYIAVAYWIEGQEIELKYEGVKSEYTGGTSVHLSMTDEAAFATTMAFSKAMKGTTEILGGLILTRVVQAGSGVSQAGMCGLSDNDVAFWAGNTIGNAEQMLAPVVIMRDGRAKFGILRFDENGNISMPIDGKSRLNILSGGLPSTNIAAWTGTYWGKTGGTTGTGDGSTTLSTFDIGLNREGHSGMTVNVSGAGYVGLRASSGTVTVGELTLTVLAGSNKVGAWKISGVVLSTSVQYFSLANVNTEVQYLYSNLSAIALRVDYSGLGSAVVVTFASNTSGDTSGDYGIHVDWLSDITTPKTNIANNGLLVLLKGTDLFQVKESNGALTTTIKGNTDIPGVLWAGTISSSGGTPTPTPTYKNAAKYASSALTCGSWDNTNKRFKITHRLGTSNFTAMVTPSSSSVSFRVAKSGNDTLYVYLSAQASFDLVLFGTN